MLLKLFISDTRRITAMRNLCCALMLLGCLNACSSSPEQVPNENKVEMDKVLTSAHVNNDEKSADNTRLDKITNNQVINDKTSENKRASAINLYEQHQVINPIVINDEVRQQYQQATSLMKQKEWLKAQALFDKVIEQQPQLSGSYVNKAIIAKQQGNLAQAQALLNQALAINKLNLYAHHIQGQVYRLQGDFDKAEQSYLAALAIWPDFTEAQASMAILLELYRGRLIDAYGYYHSYLQLKSDDEEVRRWQAALAIKIKRAGLTLPQFDDEAIHDQSKANLKPETSKIELLGENKKTPSAAEEKNND